MTTDLRLRSTLKPAKVPVNTTVNDETYINLLAYREVYNITMPEALRRILKQYFEEHPQD